MDKFPHTAILSTHKLSVVDPDKGVGGRGWLFVACPAGFSSFCDLFIFNQKYGEDLGPLGSSPRSVTD